MRFYLFEKKETEASHDHADVIGLTANTIT